MTSMIQPRAHVISHVIDSSFQAPTCCMSNYVSYIKLLLIIPRESFITMAGNDIWCQNG